MPTHKILPQEAKKIAAGGLELVSNTPLLRLNRIVESGAEVLAKLEAANLTGSVKDRVALAMVEAAEKSGRLKPGGHIVEPTSGNMGVSLAMVAAIKGYKLILTMPEGVPAYQKSLLRLYGARLEFTPDAEGMLGAIRRSTAIVDKSSNTFMPDQFSNPANPEVHRRTTAEEFWQQSGGEIDALVAGVGTGGTITGVGEVLKDRNPNIFVVAVEPQGSAVLSGGLPGSHKIYGLGAGFVPKILNREIIDRVVTVRDEEAVETCLRLAKEEGLVVGVSSGAAVFAALQVARELGRNKRVVVVLPDRGEKYFGMF